MAGDRSTNAAPAPPNGPSPTKHRRTRAEIEAIKAAIYDVLAVDHPATVRGLFYQLVGRGVVAKTEGEYKRTVGRLAAEMRRAGELPFHWIADNTRWMRKPASYSSLEHALERTAATYRRAVWDDQPAYVEVWLEKDALAGVLLEETSRYDVPLMVTRGYPSLSYVYEAAAAIAAEGKPAYLYYFGDLDPSGLDIPRTVERNLREFAPRAAIHFERVAVTPEQVARWQLPTRPTKQTDSRARSFDGESVEVDAIPPRELRALVSDRIARHLDRAALRALEVAEDSERRLLMQMAASIGGEG